MYSPLLSLGEPRSSRRPFDILLNNNQSIKQHCEEDSACPFKVGKIIYKLFPLAHCAVCIAHCFHWESLDLPDDHLPFYRYFNNNPDIKQQCEEDSACPFKVGMTI